jgi:hypothetical protein
MMVGDNMTKISQEEEEELVIPEFDAVEIVVAVMQIVPTSSCSSKGNNRRILLEQFRVVLHQC